MFLHRRKNRGSSRRKLTQILGSLLLSVSLILGVGSAAYADTYTYGDSLCGASTEEVLGVGYYGAAWRHTGSKYKWASFTYSRNGSVIVTKKAYNGKVSAWVWDSPFWGSSNTTVFNWNRG